MPLLVGVFCEERLELASNGPGDLGLGHPIRQCVGFYIGKRLKCQLLVHDIVSHVHIVFFVVAVSPNAAAPRSHQTCQAILLVFVWQESSGHAASCLSITSIESRIKLPPLSKTELFVIALIVDTLAFVGIVFSGCVVVFEIVCEQINSFRLLCIFVEVVYIANDVVIVEHVCIVILGEHGRRRGHCCACLAIVVSHISSHSRLDGGCAAEEGRSSSSRARLLFLLLGPSPRFADDILERSGGELVFVSVLLLVVKRGSSRCLAYEYRGNLRHLPHSRLKHGSFHIPPRQTKVIWGCRAGLRVGEKGL